MIDYAVEKRREEKLAMKRDTIKLIIMTVITLPLLWVFAVLMLSL